MPPAEAPTAMLAAVRARLLRPVTVLLAVLAAVFATGVQVPLAVQLAPFVASLVLLGLPHGAVDQLVPDWLAGRRARPRTVAGVVLLYVVLGALVLALWVAAPALAFAAFIALTWFHWGQGDLWALQALDGAVYLRPRALRVAVLLVRGALPMLVPLVARPGDYRRVLDATTGLFGPSAGLGRMLEPQPRLVVGVLLAVAVAATLLVTGIQARRTRSLRRWTVDATEVLVLAAYFAVVPAVLAVGLYFCLWHALRHIVRLELLDPRGGPLLRAGRLARPGAAFGRAAAPATVAALALLAVLAAVLAPTGPAGLLGAYLVLISALTLPHVAVVCLMDRREGVWARS
jgi:Brp/Blh family beta-carotene 15,15'-monooxygenase